MLENERIILQDRGGFDAGLAALMQNANKGVDPTALMAMMNNGNGAWGGNGGWWWIFIIVLFWMWGGNGFFGRNNGSQNETNADFARLAAMGNEDNNTDLLMQAIQGNKDAINSLANTLNVDSKSVSNAICTIQGSIDKVSSEVGFSSERVINAINTGNSTLASQIANCCCTTQRSIDAVNLSMTKMSYEDQLAVSNQTNTLVNAITQNALNLRDTNLANTNAIIAKIDNFENLYRQDKYDNMLAKNTALTNELSQLRQNQYILSSVTAPITAQLTSLQGEVDSIKCKLPNTVPVTYPQIKAFDASAYLAAAAGASAGAAAAEGFGAHPYGRS